MQQILNLYVKHQRILGVPQLPRVVIEQTRGFVYLDIKFDEEWNDCQITVVLKNGQANCKPVALTWVGRPLEIPPQLLVTGELWITCNGVGSDGYLKLTTEEMSEGIPILAAGDQAGEPPVVVTPELWEQVLAAVGPLHTLQTQNKSHIVGAVNEILGKAIQKIEQTKLGEGSDAINEFTVYFENGETAVLQVRNGSQGGPGDKGEPGEKGEPGMTPEFSIGTVETLEPNAEASVSLAGTKENPILNIGIPRGKPGGENKRADKVASFDDDPSTIAWYSDDRNQTAFGSSYDTSIQWKRIDDAWTRDELLGATVVTQDSSGEHTFTITEDLLEVFEYSDGTIVRVGVNLFGDNDLVSVDLEDAWLPPGLYHCADWPVAVTKVAGGEMVYGILKAKARTPDMTQPVGADKEGFLWTAPGSGGGTNFEVDENTLSMENGVLKVNTANAVEQDNTRPVTSAAVYTVVGNIEALLGTI